MPLPRPLTSRAELQQQNHELTLGFHDKLRALQESVAPPPPVSELLGRPLRPRPRPAPDPAPAIPSRPRRRKTDPVLPDPPFAGNQHLVPLTTCAHLRVEGRVQSNCVASYASRIKKGTCYIYRVLWPERCTLSIVKGRDGGWRCSELKRARNGRASADTLRFVETWLRQSQEPAADPESENHQLALRPPR